jgi:hypothetical protein
MMIKGLAKWPEVLEVLQSIHSCCDRGYFHVVPYLPANGRHKSTLCRRQFSCMDFSKPRVAQGESRHRKILHDNKCSFDRFDVSSSRCSVDFDSENMETASCSIPYYHTPVVNSSYLLDIATKYVRVASAMEHPKFVGVVRLPRWHLFQPANSAYDRLLMRISEAGLIRSSHLLDNSYLCSDSVSKLAPHRDAGLLFNRHFRFNYLRRAVPLFSGEIQLPNRRETTKSQVRRSLPLLHGRLFLRKVMKVILLI